jgi:hypothetical protein
MSKRVLRAFGTLAAGSVIVVAVAVPSIGHSQPVEQGATLPRTPWGDPDLRGVYTNITSTPLERSPALGDKEFFTAEERTAIDTLTAQNLDRPPPPGSVGVYNGFWLTLGTLSERTSLIVDPPGGRLPTLTPRAQQLADTRAAVRSGPPASWEVLNAYVRCITRGLPGAMLPGFYNHNYQILQTSDYVALLVEMIHDVRIIPLDGRPHLPGEIGQWLGDSRGHWEGDTLVVETSNFNGNVDDHDTMGPLTIVLSAGSNLRLVERFTRIDADTIDYQFTVTDLTTYTTPWTAAAPMTRIEESLYEYACHEGNYAMENMLRGARVQEAISDGSR